MKKENIPFKITMSFTPPLLYMLTDKHCQNNFSKYIRNLIKLSNNEIKRTSNDPHLTFLARKYNEHFIDTESLFNSLNQNIIQGFFEFFEDGSLEVITSPATHGFLPYMESEPSSVRAQLKNGRRAYREIWGRDPKGIWLSECAYYSGLENYLDQEGFRYFFVDTHGVEHSEPRPKFGVYAPVEVGRGILALGRDQESAKQVWSSIDGYPGDFRYREYYRDIGFDLPDEQISEFLPIPRIRTNTGIKYYRITGKTGSKDYYHPDWAMEAAGSHSQHFLTSRIQQAEQFFLKHGQPAIMTAPFDAELFGHWWYEGPQFIEFLMKKIHYDQDIIGMAHPMDSIGVIPKIQSVKMHFSTWGERGYGEVWLNPTNDWIYTHLLQCAVIIHELAHTHKNTPDKINRRILNQMGRELLLAQSSDWAFIMKYGTMVEYAERRTKVHLNIFLKLREMLKDNNFDISFLESCESENNPFPHLQFEDFL
jgi:1,4-alpha-glucan branching enzyme